MVKQDIKIKIDNIEGGKAAKIIEINGILDRLTSQEVDKEVSPLIDENVNIIIDCSKLLYINSTGLSLFLKYCIQAKRRDISFIIFNPNPSVYEVMGVSGVAKFLEVYKTKEQALDKINKK